MRFIIVLFSLSSTCLAMANTPSTQLSAEKPSAKQVDIQTLALQKQYLQTIDCRGADQLIGILKKSLDQTGDLSAKGHIASVFEEVVMNNPSCFIQASNPLPVKVCDQVEAQFIHETFFLSTR
jgi:hypothetical protein